jgi:Zn-dependent protease with chaperone function
MRPVWCLGLWRKGVLLMRSRIRFLTVAFVVVTLAAATSLLRAQTLQQDDDADKITPSFSLNVNLQANGTAVVSSYVLTQNHEQASLKPVLESALHCALSDSRTRVANYGYFGKCSLPATTAGLLRDYRISMAPLVAYANDQHLELLQVTLTLPDAEIRETIPSTSGFSFPGKTSPIMTNSLAAVRFFSWRTDAVIPESIGIHIGYDLSAMQRRVALLLAALLLPIVLALWLRRRALSAQLSDRSSIWFSYIRYQQWMLNGSLVMWWASCETTQVTPFTRFLLQNSVLQYSWLPSAVSTLITWLPPVVVWTVCVILSQPVQEQLRGLKWSRKDLALQSIYALSSSLLPLLLAVRAIAALASGSFRAAVLLFFAAFAAKLIARLKLQKLMGMQPQALTTGDLRDVAFSMASRLGIKLQQIYIIPAGKMQMANAFARTGNAIAFTDYLLQRMSRREVNYILGHELSHLRLKHLQKLSSAFALSLVAGIFLFTSFRSYIPVSPFLRYALLFSIGTLGPYFWSRRFEFAADAGAIEATSDPEAAISALFKLSSLNMHPLNWSKWSEKWLTHPSTLRRAQAIARKAAIPFERLPEIAQRGMATDGHYTIPSSAIAGAKILSTTRKTSNAAQALVAMLSAIILTPTAVALFVKYTHFSGLTQQLIYVGGFFATMAVYLTVVNFVPARKLRGVVTQLKAKVQADGVPAEAWNAVTVGLAPGPVPRTYEGHAHWDIGFLFLRSDRICYWGEETHFALRREQIISIKLGPSTPNLLRANRVYIAWRDLERATCGVFSLGCADPETMLVLRKHTQELFARLLQWHSAPAATRPIPAPLASLTAPQFGSVTGISPLTIGNRAKILKQMYLFGLLAAAIAVVAGLPFHLLQSILRVQGPLGTQGYSVGSGWYVVLVTLSVILIQYVPYFRYKDVPVLQADLGASKSSSPTKQEAEPKSNEPETVKA